MSACRAAATADEAVGAAEALGYPVALKGSAPQIAHKTELGLVHLSRRSSAQVREAFGAVEGMLRAHAPSGNSEIVLQPMAPPGVELVAAVRSDPLFGAVLVVGLGGVFVEFIKSVSTRLGAVDVVTAREMLRECRAAELLAGLRGKGPFDVAAAAEAIAALSRFGAAAEGAFGSIEINPLIVGAKGVVGVDALLTLRASDPCESRSP
jgi:succinyl-CoA synthetase beta subunit